MAILDQKTLNSSLERGEIPDVIREGFRIITDGPEQIAFQREMDMLARQIIGDAEFRKLGIRFYLTDQPYKNAGKLRHTKPPIIFFTRKMIAALKEENLRKIADEHNSDTQGLWGKPRPEEEKIPEEFVRNGKGMLLGILAHEIEHIYRGDRNSKGIEVECDKFAVKKLIELGYREQSLNEALKHIISDEDEQWRGLAHSLAEYLDVHPKTDNRVRLMDNEFYKQIWQETNFPKDAIGTRILPKPYALDEAMISIANQAGFISPVEALLNAGNYNDQDKVGKLRILQEIVKNEMPKWDRNNHSVRFEEVKKKIEDLDMRKDKFALHSEDTALRANAETVKKAVDDFADMLLEVGVEKPNNQNYRDGIYIKLADPWTSSRSVENDQEVVALGTYGKLRDALQAFIDAKNGEQANAAAKEALRLIERYHLRKPNSFFGMTLQMPKFHGASEYHMFAVEKRIYEKHGLIHEATPIPDDVAMELGKKPDWFHHVEWALAEKGTQKPIAELLQLMGINSSVDPRMQPLPPKIGQIAELEEKLLVAANGYLVGLIPNTSKYISRDADDSGRERRILQRSQWLAEANLRTIDVNQFDWSPVRSRDYKKFAQFTEKYKATLMPDVYTHKPATEFQKAFATEVKTQIGKCEFGNKNDDDFRRAISYYYMDIVRHISEIKHQKDTYLDRNHPYVTVAMEAGTLGKDDRATFLETTIPPEYREDFYSLETNPKRHDYLRQHLPFFRSAFFYMEPYDTRSLFMLLEELSGTKQNYSAYRNTTLFKDLGRIETLNFLKNNPSARLSNEQLATLYDLGKDKNGLLVPEFETALDPFAKKCAMRDLDASAGELIRAYNLHQNTPFFKSHVELREAYEQKIRERVGKITHNDAKLSLIESLLLRDKQPHAIKRYFYYPDDEQKKKDAEGSYKFLNNPEFRQWAMDNWVELAAESTARVCARNTYKEFNGNTDDDNSDDYLRAGKMTANRVLDGAEGMVRSIMLRKWLDHINAQEKLSFHVRDRLNDITADAIAKLHYHASAGEAFLDHLAFDPQFRIDTIEFLRAPLTKESCKSYSDKLRQSADYAENSYADGMTQELRNALKKARVCAELYDRDARVSMYAAEMLHRNFTNADTEYRTFLMEKVLFPPSSKTIPMHGTTPQQYVFDKVLPDTDEYAKYGRSLFTHYLSGLKPQEEYVRRIYLSAMLVAEDPGAKEPDAKKRVGKAIHTLLSSMDNPLAGKLSQAIDSSNVPEWLRNPESKTNTNIPPRWVVWEMFNQHAPKEVKETTKRLGKTRAGAIGIAVELEKDEAKMHAAGYVPEHVAAKTIYKMVRKGAAEKVNLHAPLATRMIEKAAEEYPELRNAKPILAHAVHAGVLETDFTNAPVQTEIARRSVEGVKISIGDETFTFHEVPILKASKGSHELAFAYGTLFNELPSDQKKPAAHALLTLENYLQLLGIQVDWDRHGAQAIVNGHDIYLLDRGGMAIEAPSNEDKTLFGKVIATAINEYHVNDMPFNEAITASIDSMADASGNLNHYLSTITRGQYNLGDLRRELTPQQQMQSIMAVLSTGRIDPVIRDTAMDHLAMPTKLWMAQEYAKNNPARSWLSRVMHGKKQLEAKQPENPVVIYDPNIELRRQPLDVNAIKARVIRDDESSGPPEPPTPLKPSIPSSRPTPSGGRRPRSENIRPSGAWTYDIGPRTGVVMGMTDK